MQGGPKGMAFVNGFALCKIAKVFHTTKCSLEQAFHSSKCPPKEQRKRICQITCPWITLNKLEQVLWTHGKTFNVKRKGGTSIIGRCNLRQFSHHCEHVLSPLPPDLLTRVVSVSLLIRSRRSDFENNDHKFVVREPTNIHSFIHSFIHPTNELYFVGTVIITYFVNFVNFLGNIKRRET